MYIPFQYVIEFFSLKHKRWTEYLTFHNFDSCYRCLSICKKNKPNKHFRMLKIIKLC